MITGDAIAKLIPQQGAMRMLDTIVRFDRDGIVCESARHRAPDNPLRAHGRLSVLHAIEFAAQAMAAHRRLTGEIAIAPRSGLLISVRQCTFARGRLDDCASPLTIEANRIASSADAITYGFTVTAAGAEVAAGRASIMLIEDEAIA
jgi:predicted hotdog family 3-hydroxylacyl-ACP dehydratase